MEKGIESLKNSVLRDTLQGNQCFNENGCDHEFYRMMPETNPNLIEMGMTRKCVRVSKCLHKYCDKYKWVLDRATLYDERTGKTMDEIIELWERDRSYWYMNYYQDNKQPISGLKIDKGLIEKYKSISEKKQKELETYEGFVKTLNLPDQDSIKNDLIGKINILKENIERLNNLTAIYEVCCF
jgi:hypothetical protein